MTIHLKHYFVKEKSLVDSKKLAERNIHEIVKNNQINNAVIWITKNPPFAGELSREYYEKYCKTSGAPLSNQVFSPIVSRYGFVKLKKNNHWTWFHEKL